MTREESIEIYKAHSRRLYNISLRIVRDSALAEEIMQDTILKYLSLDQDRKPALPMAVTAWLSKTCIRASIDELRKRKREESFLEEYASEEAPTYFAATGNETAYEKELPGIDKIKMAIASLPDAYRLIINLVLIEGLDYEEISHYTSEKEGTIRTRYSRARQMLAERLR